MSPTDWFLVGLLVIFAGFTFLSIRATAHAEAKAQKYMGAYEREQRDHRYTQDQYFQVQSRYNSLKREYDEIAELEEGEDYVRESLGFPPDHEESA